MNRSSHHLSNERVGTTSPESRDLTKFTLKHDNGVCASADWPQASGGALSGRKYVGGGSTLAGLRSATVAAAVQDCLSSSPEMWWPTRRQRTPFLPQSSLLILSDSMLSKTRHSETTSERASISWTTETTS